ncbi:hypothetical protein [Sphingomonas sp. AX6]|uniref:hypothetical protein n=1 Tax=Sphingomonas sp. AX6 TaxID=2653171 RepID=UPI001359E24F|nr:hypothetical protein [Sphingomonas sp. AX6]
MLNSLSSVAIALALSVPAPTPAPAPAPAQDVGDASSEAKPKKERLICKTQFRTESRLNPKRRCLTQAAWNAEAKLDNVEIDDQRAR